MESMSMDMSSMSMDMSSMSMQMSSMASMSSSMSMDMSSMSSSMMSHMSSMSMDMPMSTSGSMTGSMTESMTGSMTGSMDMSMPMSTSMASMSGMASNGSMASSMGGMNMKKMHMNMWLTPTYNDYPVLFQHLKADTSGKAFGIFLLIVVAAFFYKGVTFTSWCLEVHWFKKWTSDNTGSSSSSSFNPFKRKNRDEEIINSDMSPAPAVPNVILTFLTPSFRDLFHDFIRAILAFISTMIVYMLMLVAMTYVLTYVFAVVTGLALAEAFFNRIKIILMKRWEIQREIALMNACPGQGHCNCGHHRADNFSTSSDDEYNEKSNEHMASHTEHNKNCGCVNNAKERARADQHIERTALENNRLQQQSATMAPDLTPADGLHS